MSRLVRRLAAVPRTLAAVTLTGLLVVGVPAALWTQIGWPLPRQVPTVAELLDGLTAPLPDTVILNVLAVVCWLAWAQLTVGLIVETGAQLRGRAAPRLRLVGPMQALAARLVGAALVTALVLPTRAGATPAPPPAVSVAVQQLHLAATVTPQPPDTRAPAEAGPRDDGEGYTVRPRDTAWGLAETYSPDRDGLRWKGLYALNAGRLQPDGDRWADPGLLRPGWQLEFPEDWDRPPAPPPAAPEPERAPPSTVEPGQAPTPTPPPTTAPGQAPPPSTPPPAAQAPDGPDAQNDTDDPASVSRSPSGSIIWVSLAFSTLLALEILRRRRRRHRVPAPPTPNLHHTPDTTDPTLRWLENLARQPPEPPDDDTDPQLTAAPPELVSDRIQRHLTDPPPPGPIPIGHRHGTEITLNLAELGGLTLTGPGAPGVARALTTTTLSSAPAATVGVLLVGDELLGQVPAFQGMRRYPDLAAALQDLEVDLVHRTRLLDRTQTATLAELRAADPAEPAPSLLLVADHPDAEHVSRLRTLVERGRHLDATALLLNTKPASLGAHLEVTAASTVTSGHTAELEHKLADVELFSLTIPDAAAILATLAAARTEDTPQPPPTPPPPATLDADPAAPAPDTPAATPEHPPPEPFAVPGRPPGSPTPPVQVSVLGGYQLRAGDVEVTGGMRRTAWELLLYFLLHPQGATLPTAVDTIWPDTRLGRESDTFWNALSSLRRRLRTATGIDDLAVIQHDEDGDSYRIDPAAVDCDVWHLQAAMAAAARAPDDHAAARALTRAASAYGGELAGGAYGWAESARQQLRTTATDTLARLADLRETAGDPHGAIAALTRATDVDPAAEEIYRRLMRLQAAHQGIDEAERTYRRLETRLEELDADVDAATAQLRHELTQQQRQQRRKRARPATQPRPPTSSNPQPPTSRKRRPPTQSPT